RERRYTDWAGRIVIDRGPLDSAGDEDADGLRNREEQARGLDPQSPDTDGDGFGDLADGYFGAGDGCGAGDGSGVGVCWFALTIGNHDPSGVGCENPPLAGSVPRWMGSDSTGWDDGKRAKTWVVWVGRPKKGKLIAISAQNGFIDPPQVLVGVSDEKGRKQVTLQADAQRERCGEREAIHAGFSCWWDRRTYRSSRGRIVTRR
ncbi:MAG: hypothetical protein IT438_14455, partial [Phycisphaerales bacterium]|nr:hypothetical protein [Phycisphaerales bacterium]